MQSRGLRVTFPQHSRVSHGNCRITVSIVLTRRAIIFPSKGCLRDQAAGDSSKRRTSVTSRILKKSDHDFFSSQRKKCDFCFAPFFEHLRVRKMCGTSLHRSNRLLKAVFQQPVRERHNILPPWPSLPGGSNMTSRAATTARKRAQSD